jgi:transcription antitermination factor NusB
MRRKRKAREAAVQCIYLLYLMEQPLSAARLEKEYYEHWQADSEELEPAFSDALPDKPLFRRLLEGVVSERTAIEARIRTLLRPEWPFERMSPLLRALLVCAVHELTSNAKMPAPKLIDEYVRLTNRFFEPEEAAFVNGFLAKCPGSTPIAPIQGGPAEHG